MKSQKNIVHDISSASQQIVISATTYTKRKALKNVSAGHLQLDTELRRISVTAQGILKVLDSSSLPDSPPLDNRLEDWLSSNELPVCLDTLNEMDKILQPNSDGWMNMTFSRVNPFHASPPEDKIDRAIKLFDSRRDYFHFLLTTDVWNREQPRSQQPQVSSVHAQDDPLTIGQPAVPDEWDVDLVSETDRSSDTAESFAMVDIPTITEENMAARMNNLGKIDDILPWLDGLNCITKQEAMLSLRQPDTCTWLNSAPEYEFWSHNDDSFLWVQGKPGSGKTVLAAYVIDSLKHDSRSEEFLAFFYCDFRDDRSTSAAGVMRSLLSQFLHHIRSRDVDPGEVLDRLVEEKDEDTSILQNVEDLAHLVSQAAGLFGRQPFVVIDALDECNDVQKLLDGLLILSRNGMRLLVTSRPLQVIKDGLSGLPSISIDHAVSEDIVLHVTRELDSRRRLRDFDVDSKTEIHTVLCDRADGMFRWVQCQMDTLNQCATKAKVREALDNLPVGLDETYRRILVSIDIDTPMGKLALRTLMWLVGALRPLRLSEILDGLAIDLERQEMDADIGPMHKSALLDTCGSLVAYNEDTDVLILSHFSVKEYLSGDITQNMLPQYHISYQAAHQHLARLCVCYLTLCLKHDHTAHDQSHDENSTVQERLYISEAPLASSSISQELLDYVLTNGFNHLAYLSPADHVVLDDISTLQSDIQKYPGAWDGLCRMAQDHRTPTPWPTRNHDFMFYILIAFGSPSLLREFLDRSHNAILPKYQTNPLIYAARFGKIEHAQILLSCGANVNSKGLVVDAPRQALPIEIAVGRRHESMVDLFLSARSVVPERLFALATYYKKYPVRIIRSLLETDKFVEWAADPTHKLPSPLRILEQRPSLAYEGDVIAIIRRLVQIGIDLAEEDSPGRTALYFAILGGYPSIVIDLLLLGAPLHPHSVISALSSATHSKRIAILRLIVIARADIFTQVDDGDHLAIHRVIQLFPQRDCLVAVKILTVAGCKPFFRNASQKTPLDLALEKGYSSVADYLLSLGSPPSDVDILPLAILQSKCPAKWKVRTLRTLGLSEEDLHRVTTSGDTLLHQAVTLADGKEGPEVVEFLVDAGCDISARNGQGKTPLHIAINRGCIHVVEYILSLHHHLPDDILSSVFESLYLREDQVTVFFMLMGNGADVHFLGPDGNNYLHVALSSFRTIDEKSIPLESHLNRLLMVVEVLVEAGCDPFLPNAHELTPLHLAVAKGFVSVVEYLLLATPFPEGLPMDILACVFDEQVPRPRDTLDVIELLIVNGANVHIQVPTANRGTLLHAAIKLISGDSDDSRNTVLQAILGTLVEAGCDPSECDENGHPPVYFAVTTGRVEAVEYLLPQTVPFPHDLWHATSFAPENTRDLLWHVLEQYQSNVEFDKESRAPPENSISESSPDFKDPDI